MMPVNDELIDRFLDGDVSDAEAGEVMEWLESPANLDRFARRAELHADLRSSLRRRSIQTNALEACDENEIARALTLSDQPDGAGRRPSRLLVGFGVVALAAAACLLIAFMMPSQGPEPASSQQFLATIVSEIDMVLSSTDSSWDEPGLLAGEYHLQQGLLHLRFDGGVMVYVEAPARFEVASGKRFVLHGGRLSASVPPEGIGFTVDTPEAEVTDFGTEFSVEVGSGTSEVHVYDGLVRVQPRAMKDGRAGEAIDLRTSQAVKIEDANEKPTKIKLAKDRFIRNFEEPRRRYPRSVKRLSPVAYYRMPIRDKGLVSEPPEYSGVVLTGDGIRPPHASGVFAGGSLRVMADSSGRGGRVDSPPPLSTGQFTLAVYVYLEAPAHEGTVATNIRGDEGSFALALDEHGLLQVTIRNRDGELQSATSAALLPPKTWRHVVVTADGEHLRIYEDGQLSASTPCAMLAASDSETIWFGTDADGIGLWNGRIDELALFDRALSEQDIAGLYQAALEEMARSE